MLTSGRFNLKILNFKKIKFQHSQHPVEIYSTAFTIIFLVIKSICIKRRVSFPAFHLIKLVPYHEVRTWYLYQMVIHQTMLHLWSEIGNLPVCLLREQLKVEIMT